MRDILADVDRWQRDGAVVALATVVQTWGSSPRRAGSKMALASDGRIVGSVSGGCVENAVFEAGIEVLKTNQPQLLHFGVADETAWEVGLACGGSIDIFVKPLDKIFYKELHVVIENELPAVMITVIRGPDEILDREILIREDEQATGTLGSEWDEAVGELANAAFTSGISQRVALNESVEIFLEVILPPPTLIIVGGVHIAISLTSLAKTLGYRTIVIDPRRTWGNKERFPHVDQLIQAWPADAFGQLKVTRSTAIAMLTHDPKFDDPALQVALNSPAFYVGALGSRSTHAKRRTRLLNNGVSEAQLSRLHAPIGLNIGATSPEEIALSIMSEIVSVHRKQNQTSVKNEAERSLVSSF